MGSVAPKISDIKNSSALNVTNIGVIPAGTVSLGPYIMTLSEMSFHNNAAEKSLPEYKLCDVMLESSTILTCATLEYIPTL